MISRNLPILYQCATDHLFRNYLVRQGGTTYKSLKKNQQTLVAGRYKCLQQICLMSSTFLSSVYHIQISSILHASPNCVSDNNIKGWSQVHITFENTQSLITFAFAHSEQIRIMLRRFGYRRSGANLCLKTDGTEL